MQRQSLASLSSRYRGDQADCKAQFSHPTGGAAYGDGGHEATATFSSDGACTGT